MAYYLSPVFQDAQLATSTGIPLVGGKLYTYLSSSTTLATVYQDDAGGSSHTNPIILNARGEPPAPIWILGGQSIKFALHDAADVPIRTIDDVTGIGDPNGITNTVSEWMTFSHAPTYVSAASFTVAGNQTADLNVGRRVKIPVSGNTSYGTITASAFGAVTTVTIDTTNSVGLDSSIDALSSFEIGILSGDNSSLPVWAGALALIADVSDRTKRLALGLSNLTTATKRTWTVQNKSGTIPLAEDLSAPYNASLAASVSGNVLTINLKNAAGNDASAGDPVYIPFRHATVTTGTPVVVAVTAALPLSIPQGATLGFANSEAARIHIYALNNSGIVELVAYRAQTGGDVAPLSETGVVTTTAVTTGPNSAQVPYSASARSNVAVSYLGYIEIATGATAGDWSSNPTAIVTYRPGLPKPGQVVQTVATSTGSASTFGTGGGEMIPLDNTIPQSGEGTQILSKAITPKSIYNVMRVEAAAYMTVNSAVHVIMALFNGGANALAAMTVLQGNANTGAFPLRYTAVASSASAITYSLRAGPATSATVTLNGQGGSQIFGGTLLSSMTVNEIWA